MFCTTTAQLWLRQAASPALLSRKENVTRKQPPSQNPVTFSLFSSIPESPPQRFAKTPVIQLSNMQMPTLLLFTDLTEQNSWQNRQANKRLYLLLSVTCYWTSTLKDIRTSCASAVWMPEVLETSSKGNLQVGWTQLTFSAPNLHDKDRSPCRPQMAQSGPEGTARPSDQEREQEAAGRRAGGAGLHGHHQALAVLLSLCSPDKATSSHPDSFSEFTTPQGK